MVGVGLLDGELVGLTVPLPVLVPVGVGVLVADEDEEELLLFEGDEVVDIDCVLVGVLVLLGESDGLLVAVIVLDMVVDELGVPLELVELLGDGDWVCTVLNDRAGLLANVNVTGEGPFDSVIEGVGVLVVLCENPKIEVSQL